MLGSVPQSAKLKELAALFSWGAKSLVGMGFGPVAVSVFPMRSGSENPYEAQKIQHDRTRSFIKVSTSNLGRFQFSVEKAYSVK